MLSNTAAPRYYSEFREKVLKREIPVNYEIAMEMARIEKLIEDPQYFYDDEAVEGFINFCEAEMVLTDGSDVQLLDSFKLWGEQLFGWFYFIKRQVYVPGPNGGTYKTELVKRRLTKKQYLIVARGAAKSLYMSWIHAYMLVVDPATTQQITTAPTMLQAEEVINPITTAITRARGPVINFLTQGSKNNTTGSAANRPQLQSTKKGIQNFMTNSILQVRPMTIDKLQGLRSKVSTVDEWLSGDTREDVIGAIEQGASKVPDYLIVACSSEGNVRNGVGDTIKMELLDILKGEYPAPHVSIWHYKLDDLSEIEDPFMWLKAQPNLGKTVSFQTYEEDKIRAEKSPSARNDILAKRWGIAMEGYTYFFKFEDTLPHRPQNFRGMSCTLGIDLSQGDDFCSFTFLIPLSLERFGVKTRNYITSKTMSNLPAATRIKYETFLAEGSLVVIEGSILDLDEVYDDIDEYIIINNYDVVGVGYDPYNAASFIDRYEREHGPYGIMKVPQGARTESVPLGELRSLAEDRNLIFDEDIMSFCMGNAITIEDTNGNRKLHKKRAADKIDCVAALVDAWVSYKNNKDAFM